MTNGEHLKSIFERAARGGFDVRLTLQGIREETHGTLRARLIRDLLTSEEFAKAFWPDRDDYSVMGLPRKYMALRMQHDPAEYLYHQMGDCE